MCICGFGMMVGFMRSFAWLLLWMHGRAFIFYMVRLFNNHMIRWTVKNYEKNVLSFLC